LGSRNQHKKKVYPMNTPYALLIGIDRSDKDLDFTVLDGTGKVIERGKVSTDPAALHPWMETWRERVAVGGRIVVAFEQPAPNLIVFFSQFEGVVGIYPLNPAAVRSLLPKLRPKQRAQRPHRRRDDRSLRIPLSW
jgi:hypothetical protein